MLALGQRPRNSVAMQTSAESAFQSGVRAKVQAVNRAFSAGLFWATNPGALPQAQLSVPRHRR